MSQSPDVLEIQLDNEQILGAVQIGEAPQAYALGFVEEVPEQSEAGTNHIFKQGWGLTRHWSEDNPQFWLSMERNFLEEGREAFGAAFEFIVEWKCEDEENVRGIYLYAPKEQKEGALLHLCFDKFALVKNDSDRTTQFVIDTTTGIMEWYDTLHVFPTNNAPFAQQENAAGSGRLNLPYVSDLDRVLTEGNAHTELNHYVDGYLIVSGAQVSNLALIQVGASATTIGRIDLNAGDSLRGQIEVSSGVPWMKYRAASHQYMAIDSTLWATVSTTGVNLASGRVYQIDGTTLLAGQGAAISSPSGGSIVDTEARTAINSILARMRAATPSIAT